jgi:hypothetical protein
MNVHLRNLVMTVVIALGSVSLAACASPLGHAKQLFRSAQYAEAKSALEAMEKEPLTDAQVLEYELYRGLVHHSLGDVTRGAMWLNRAKIHNELRPGMLSPDDAARLRLGLEGVREAPLP